MGIGRIALEWPVLRQLREGDVLGRGRAVQSEHTRSTKARTLTADRVARSVCPYCAVGCGQRIYVKDEKIVQIEGDLDSPISRGRLCPKGSASLQLVTSPRRQKTVRYRAPHASDWTHISVEQATEMIADRIIDTRRRTWQDVDDKGRKLNRTMGFAALGGAALDNEENYLIKKLFTGLGAVQIENQARI